MDQKKPLPKNAAQLIWGIALVMAGVGMFLYMPARMAQIAQIEGFSKMLGVIRACLYLVMIILIGGGSQKIYRFIKSSKPDSDL